MRTKVCVFLLVLILYALVWPVRAAHLHTAVREVLPQQSTSVTLNPSKDNTLYEDDQGLTSNGSGDYFFAGKTNAGDIRRGLVAFDVASAIPAGSTIVSVTLRLALSQTRSGAQDVALHRLNADWGEGASNAGGEEGRGTTATPNDATWLHRFYETELWTTPGGDFAPVASATASVGGTFGYYTWGSTPELVADVQGWLDDPATSYGWLVLGNEGAEATAKRFNARENTADPPELMIAYTASEVPTAPVYLPMLQN